MTKIYKRVIYIISKKITKENNNTPRYKKIKVKSTIILRIKKIK